MSATEQKAETNKSQVTYTQRGFGIVEFKDYNGITCTIQESSAGSASCIWLGVKDAHPQILAKDAKSLGMDVSKAEKSPFTGEVVGHIDYPVPKQVHFTTRMHLTQAQAAALLPYLERFVKTGYLEERSENDSDDDD